MKLAVQDFQVYGGYVPARDVGAAAAGQAHRRHVYHVHLQGSGCRVQGSGCRVQGAGFRVQGSGFRVQGSGFRVHVHLFVGAWGFRVGCCELEVGGRRGTRSECSRRTRVRCVTKSPWRRGLGSLPGDCVCVRERGGGTGCCPEPSTHAGRLPPLRR